MEKWRSVMKKYPLWATVLRLTEGGLAEPHVLVPVSLLEKAMDALQASQEHADMLNTARFEALPQESARGVAGCGEGEMITRSR